MHRAKGEGCLQALLLPAGPPKLRPAPLKSLRFLVSGSTVWGPEGRDVQVGHPGSQLKG